MATEDSSRAAVEGTRIDLSIDASPLRKLGLPSSDEIEITVLGINENAGESIVIHIGNQDWIVIDSCRTQDGIVLPLFYLRSIGVDLNKVKRVACTHLHNDHLNGLSNVLSECKQAQFAYPLIGDENTLRYVVAQYRREQNIPERGTFGEFMNCIKLARKEKRGEVLLNLDTPLYADANRYVMGVSPSRLMNELYQWRLLRYNLGDPIPTKMLKTNFCSVATILRVGSVNAILGADLEVNRDSKDDIHSCIQKCKRRSKRGWCDVFVGSQYFPCFKYDYIKIPHHSSKTGFCDKLWTEQMDSSVRIGTSTVFLDGDNALPSKQMIDEYSKVCSELYYTSESPVFKKDKKRGAKIDEKKGIAYDDVSVVPEQVGVVTSRKLINGGPWSTSIFYSAIRAK